MADGRLVLRDELRQQLRELQRKFHDLRLRPSTPGSAVVVGPVAFEVSEGNFKGLQGLFELRMDVPWDYPRSPPRVRETGGRIKPGEHVNADLTLCLASPIDLELALLEQPTLLRFFERFVISFLIGFAHYKRTGRFPFGERSHGSQGELEGLADWLNCRAHPPVIVACLQQLISVRRWADDQTCPCGSKRAYSECHEPLFAGLRVRHGPQNVVELAWRHLDLLGYSGGNKESQIGALQRDIAEELTGQTARLGLAAPNIHFGHGGHPRGGSRA